MTDRITSLPLEIVLHILRYLPFDALLAFGETCRANYDYHVLGLQELRLGIFEKRVHSMISLLQAGWATPDQLARTWGDNERGTNYVISVIRPNDKAMTKSPSHRYPWQRADSSRHGPSPHDKPLSHEQMVRLQNRIFAKVLNRYGPALRSLEFMAYDISMEGAKMLGTKCRDALRHLALRFEHPHIRDGPMRPSTWLQPALASEAWNPLIGIGEFRRMGLHSLESLVLERAGITSWQLMMLVKGNSNLTVLKLRTCRGARPEFLNWLGGIENDLDEPKTQPSGEVPGAKLEVLWLEHCHRLLSSPIEGYDDLPDGICDYGLEWVRGLTSLQSLSFSESANIPSEFVERANRTIWKIPEVILPYCLESNDSAIAVDPLWK